MLFFFDQNQSSQKSFVESALADSKDFMKDASGLVHVVT